MKYDTMKTVLNPDKVLSDTLVSAFGLDCYLDIISEIQNADFKADEQFRKKFNGFFRVRQKSQKWYDTYYSLMEQQKSKYMTFGEILNVLFAQSNAVEASFASKLMAAVNPQLPIWDRYVLTHLGLDRDWAKCRREEPSVRIEKAIEIYQDICNWYQQFLKTKEGKACVRKFDEVLPEYRECITDVKKIDFWIWSKR